MRRGQAEILGLAVVVVLMVIGFAIAMQFSLRPRDNVKRQVTDRQLASAMLTALLNTNLECKDVTLAEVLQDCASSNVFEYCGSPRRRACQEAAYVTGLILNRTLGEWGKDYQLQAYTKSEPKFNHTIGGCGLGLSDRESEIFPVPTARETIYLRLDVCV